ncbi:PREDICTED: histone-lysine N-methyltransferase, H3 lysine-79 specific-like [Nelumbo nucifera]|uniref:Histone-lysine N-methyltransferase, H3 lysine-79 specific-like n=1 Tax=Nelumbo nucifera TaxID=4432 RepID=A0A1U7YXA6_NELNU|nr:PREDICTED: histone-lysine N-methyltransferase, H3 lysine-79 specific-like [Nelumbo nucifera]
MMPPRRKKWTEEEERTLIDKYGEMLSDGTLAKMKTREKKFRPIAAQVNSMHHARDPVAFPWLWSWKDASTKVQNMRHQYLLVKQKIKKPSVGVTGDGSSGEQPEEFDWVEGLSHWSNFLRYKDVFGDVTLGSPNIDQMTAVTAGNRENGRSFAGKGRPMDVMRYGHLGPSPEGGFGVGIDGGENGILGLGLGFEYDGEEADDNNNNNINHGKEDGEDGFEYEEVDPNGLETRQKRKKLKGLEKWAWSFLVNQLAQLREREARFEDREVERDKERQRKEQFRAELEQKRERRWEEREREREERERTRENLRRERLKEWEAMEKESAERERRRREEELMEQREWEERMERRRLDWKKRMDDMLSQHRAAMDQIQSRILHDQQALTSQLLGIVAQWTSHPAGLSDHTGAGNPYLSQMIQNLHHVNGVVHGENRVDGDNDQFIVDG